MALVEYIYHIDIMTAWLANIIQSDCIVLHACALAILIEIPI